MYVVIPSIVMERKCLLDYNGSAYFYGSLAEPMSCIVGGFHANYHTVQGSYVHSMGIVEGGCCAILAGVGPMGMGGIDYACLLYTSLFAVILCAGSVFIGVVFALKLVTFNEVKRILKKNVKSP